MRRNEAFVLSQRLHMTNEMRQVNRDREERKRKWRDVGNRERAREERGRERKIQYEDIKGGNREERYRGERLKQRA